MYTVWCCGYSTRTRFRAVSLGTVLACNQGVEPLFEDPDGELGELCTPKGSQINYMVKEAIKVLVAQIDLEGVSLREAQILINDHVGSEIARAIIMRRKVFSGKP